VKISMNNSVRHLQVTPSPKYPFGCRVDGADIAQGLDAATFAEIEAALHRHLVVCVSGVPYGPERLVAFSQMFGPLEINVAKTFHHGNLPQVNVLSNRIVDGKPEGAPDAGQSWHTDMSYNRISGRATVLHAHMVPFDDHGRAMGDTAFRDCHAAYAALPEALRARLDGLEAVHEFEKNWNLMISQGSKRPAFTDAQRREKPPVVHPLVLHHPWTGRKSLYVNRGLTQRIVGLSVRESDDLLEFLFDHQEQPQFEFRHEWRVGDTLIWDNCATIHLATGGYGARPRVMIRTQVLGDEQKYRAANSVFGGRFYDAANAQPVAASSAE